MPFTLILDMKIKPELLAEFMAHFKENLPGTRDFEGCEYVDVYQDEADPARVVCVEGWSSPERFAAYGAWRREQGDVEAFMRYYDGTPSLTRLQLSEGMQPA
jgi:quinol monooxygenase YgiN